MKKILFLRDNYPNPRFEKRLLWLKEYYDVYLVYWEKRKASEWKDFEQTGVNVHPIKVHANYNNPLKRIPQYISFVHKAKKIINDIKPDLIYAESLDSLNIAYSYLKKVKKCKIVYEVADLHRYIIDFQKKIYMKIVQKILRNIEKRETRAIELLVLTSEQYYHMYYKAFVDEKYVMVIPNIPDVSALKNYTKQTDNHMFTVGFVGGIRYIEQIKMLVEAAEEVGCKVLLAGEEHGTEIRDRVSAMSNVKYLGRFEFASQAANIYQECDVVYSVYNADMKNVQVALPNKLYEAIYCELPIIVAKGTYLANLVEQWNVGIAVSHIDKNELISELIRLSTDKKYYDGFVAGCSRRKDSINPENDRKKLVKKINDILGQNMIIE